MSDEEVVEILESEDMSEDDVKEAAIELLSEQASELGYVVLPGIKYIQLLRDANETPSPENVKSVQMSSIVQEFLEAERADINKHTKNHEELSRLVDLVREEFPPQSSIWNIIGGGIKAVYNL